MMEEQIFYLIKDVGVPTFFCGMISLVLYKVVGVGAKVIESNTEALTQLKTTVQIMSGKLEVIVK